MTKEIIVEIEGTSPLLMNKYNVERELQRQKGKRINKVYDSEEEAELSAYWGSGKKKELIIPSGIIYAAILNASSFHKIGKRSAKSILAGSLRVQGMDGSEEISLGTDTYAIDVRPVVISRARILKSRAKLDKWKAQFKILYNENAIADGDMIKPVLTEAGIRIGIMDFRPTKSGYYGCFKVNSWKVVD